MDVIGLTQSFIRDMIATYRAQPALWKVNSPEYRSKTHKTQAYQALVNKCREYVNEADREFVKTKINSLRTSFRKEYRKVEASKRTAIDPDEIYKPHLWYYDLLTFLIENNTEKSAGASSHAHSERAVLHNTDDDLNNSQDDFKTEIVVPAFQAVEEEFEDPLHTESYNHNTTITSKRKRPAEGNVGLPSKVEDVFDAIGKNVAHKLREMSEHQRIIAEKIISDVMYHGQMENLTMQSQLQL